jgi:hypothetical protein
MAATGRWLTSPITADVGAVPSWHLTGRTVGEVARYAGFRGCAGCCTSTPSSSRSPAAPCWSCRAGCPPWCWPSSGRSPGRDRARTGLDRGAQGSLSCGGRLRFPVGATLFGLGVDDPATRSGRLQTLGLGSASLTASLVPLGLDPVCRDRLTLLSGLGCGSVLPSVQPGGGGQMRAGGGVPPPGPETSGICALPMRSGARSLPRYIAVNPCGTRRACFGRYGAMGSGEGRPRCPRRGRPWWSPPRSGGPSTSFDRGGRPARRTC